MDKQQLLKMHVHDFGLFLGFLSGLVYTSVCGIPRFWILRFLNGIPSRSPLCQARVPYLRLAQITTFEESLVMTFNKASMVKVRMMKRTERLHRSENKLLESRFEDIKIHMVQGDDPSVTDTKLSKYQQNHPKNPLGQSSKCCRVLPKKCDENRAIGARQ